ncbi:hypothetical protein PV10_00210 [Exophiala mesophila]|uniref:Cytochrome P450 52A13 n=1 Tax=Exophiala mesophila TaxID=212818 RepID=A0A0D1ZQS0_EXOME|nr:uncharacterized protein PV10_00210 [Exophiala mesophila]KIV96329.1 hypothetical protein PV10_00210 [Exophiala mesophila]
MIDLGRYVAAACGLLATYVAYWIVSRFLTNRRHARRAQQLGCQEPWDRPYRLPLAYDLIQEIQKADAENVVPDYFMEMYDMVGKRATWRQNFLGVRNIITTDPKNIQAVLATQFTDFSIGSTRRNNFYPMFGNGVFTVDGKSWEHARGMLRPQFARQQVSDLQLEEIHVSDMFKQLPAGADGWTEFTDLVPLFFRLTLDSATEFLFGQSVASQNAAGKYGEKRVVEKGGLDWASFAKCFDAGTMTITHRSRLGELYWLHNPADFKVNCREVHKFADYYVNLALTDPASLGGHNSELGDKERYIFLKELVQQTRDPIELRSQLLNILLAGRDTTAGLLGWVFYSLVRHPHVFKKLRKILLDEFGTYQNPKNLSFENLKACTYLQHILSETLRLYPTVPINSRRAVRDTTIPRGGGPDGTAPLYIKEGQEVNYVVHIMHHRKDIWGPDADEFNPERWVGRKVGWEFLPFNGGPRICLGQQFALTEAGYVITRIMQKFDAIETNETDPIVRHQFSLTTSPYRLPLRLHEAKE